MIDFMIKIYNPNHDHNSPSTAAPIVSLSQKLVSSLSVSKFIGVLGMY